MPQAFSILFGAFYTVAVCWALGRLLFRRLGVTFFRHEDHGPAFVCGAACLSALVFVVAAAGLVHEGVFLALGIAVLAAAWRAGALRVSGERMPPLGVRWKLLCLVVFGFFGVLGFFHAMAPEISSDGSGYHLGSVARYYRDHGFRRVTTSMYEHLSHGVEMLFLFAYAFGRHSSAAMVHFAFLAALAHSMICYGRRFGCASAGAAGALLVFACPVVGIDAASAYNDVAVAAVLFSLHHLLQVWDTANRRGLLVPIGVLAGFAYAVKYTAFLAVPYALGFIAWRSWRRRLPMTRPLAAIAGCALVMIAPWTIKNWVWVDNPVAPFFNRVFPNPYVHVAFEEEYAKRMRNYDGLKSHWDIPKELTVRGGVLQGLLGPVFLLAPIALLAVRFQTGRRLLAAGLLFGLTYATNIGTRFLIPALPFLALSMALALARTPGLTALVVVAHAYSAWPSIMRDYCDRYAWRLDRIPTRQALRWEPEDRYMDRVWPPYATARMVEAMVPANGKVLTFNGLAESYTRREVLVAYRAALNGMLGEIMWTPVMPEYPPVGRVRFRFASQPLKKLRVVQTASGSPEHWTISEFRVYQRGRELPRTPGWRLTAKPNPWNVGLAFDNSPVTRWKCQYPLYSGMYVEVDFGRAEETDLVVLECSLGQETVRLRLEGMDARGRLIPLSETPELSRTPPIFGLRRAAAEELKLRGVTHLLVHENDLFGNDYRDMAEAWGLTELGERYGFRLYKIN